MNYQCPQWTKNTDLYFYNKDEWGGDAGGQSGGMVVGDPNRDDNELQTVANTTACAWISACENNETCIKNCPIALGAT